MNVEMSRDRLSLSFLDANRHALGIPESAPYQGARAAIKKAFPKHVERILI